MSIKFSPNKIRVGGENRLDYRALEQRLDVFYLRTSHRIPGYRAPLSYEIFQVECYKYHFVGGHKHRFALRDYYRHIDLYEWLFRAATGSR